MKVVVLCLPDGSDFHDPGPEVTATRDVHLVPAWDGRATGLVGWSDGGLDAVALAAAHADLVERLVLVSAPFPADGPPSGVAQVTAKTLLLFGTADPRTGSAHARRWKQALANSRIEMVPGGNSDILARVWPRVLSHLAPGTTRRGRK